MKVHVAIKNDWLQVQQKYKQRQGIENTISSSHPNM